MLRVCLALLLAVCSIAAETYNGSIMPQCPYNNTGAELSPKLFVKTWWFVYGTPNPYEPAVDCPNEVITYDYVTKIWQSVKSGCNLETGEYFHVLTERFTDVQGGWIRLFYNTEYNSGVKKSYENIIIRDMDEDSAAEVYCAENDQFTGTGGELITTMQNPSQEVIDQGLQKFKDIGADITKLKPYNQKGCPPFDPSKLSYF